MAAEKENKSGTSCKRNGRNTKRIKNRYIVALLIVMASFLITPLCIGIAYAERGYKAYGGEYLIIPLGFVLAISLLTIASDLDKGRGQ